MPAGAAGAAGGLRRRLLRKLRFIDEKDIVQLKGRMGCELSSCDEILLTELVFRNNFAEMEVDHIVALSDDGEHEVPNLQLLCPYCNRVKGTQGSQGFRMKMTELRSHNAATGVMVDEREAMLTGRRLLQRTLLGLGS